MRSSVATLMLILLGASACPGTALALRWPAPGHLPLPVMTQALAQTATLSAEEAARRAKEQYGGRVLSVQLIEGGDEAPHYEVKLIADGTVRVVRIELR